MRVAYDEVLGRHGEAGAGRRRQRPVGGGISVFLRRICTWWPPPLDFAASHMAYNAPNRGEVSDPSFRRLQALLKGGAGRRRPDGECRHHAGRKKINLGYVRPPNYLGIRALLDLIEFAPLLPLRITWLATFYGFWTRRPVGVVPRRVPACRGMLGVISAGALLGAPGTTVGWR